MKKIKYSILLILPFLSCNNNQNNDNQTIENLQVKELCVDSLENQTIKTSTNNLIEGFDDAPSK